MNNIDEICIIEDTRNVAQKHENINSYFRMCRIKVLRSKMPFGDYQLVNKGNLVIDTKKDALELFSNLTQDHERFKREITRANEFNIGIVILIEEEDFYANLDVFEKWYKVPCWKSDGWRTSADGQSRYRTHRKGEPMSKVNVGAIVKAMRTMQERYAVLFKFTTKEKCGEDIINILYNKADRYDEYFRNKLIQIRSNITNE